MYNAFNVVYADHLVPLIAIIVSRIFYNFQHANFQTWAFSATIIIFDIILTILGPLLTSSDWLIDQPYTPLLVLYMSIFFAVIIYRLLWSDLLHNYVRTHHLDICDNLTVYGKEVIIFTEICATILLYIGAEDLLIASNKILIQASLSQSSATYSLTILFWVVGLRFLYNLFLGKYTTLGFWALFILTMFFMSIYGSRDNFALNCVIVFMVIQYAFKYLINEENLWYLLYKLQWSEARYAYSIHFIAAGLELLSFLMLLSLFRNTYGSLNELRTYFAMLENVLIPTI